MSEVKILLVEDNPGHATLIKKNLRRANIHNELVVIGDGQHALDYLWDEDGKLTEDSGGPLLILLDLNLPGMDGYQVLERIKSDDRTRHIPVIVLTTTDNTQEMEKCYRLGCSIYITKPVEYEQFSEAIQRLGLFLLVATLPEGEVNA